MNWNEILNTLLVTIITGVVPLLTGFLIKFVNTKISEAKTKTNNQVIDLALSSLNDLITTVVTSLTQTIVDAAKKNGTFTKEMGQEILEQAKATIKIAVTQETKEIIENLYNMDFDSWLTNKIEATVKETK